MSVLNPTINDEDKIHKELDKLDKTMKDLFQLIEKDIGKIQQPGPGISRNIEEIEKIAKNFELSYEKLYESLNELKLPGTVIKYYTESQVRDEVKKNNKDK